MYRALKVALVLTTLVTLWPGVADAAVPDTFTFGGAGFGHGVGMSQWGAYGQAQEGRSAAQILGHYYPGTSLTGVDENVGIRVNLIDAASAQARGEALAAGGGALRAVAGAQTLDAAGQTLSLSVVGDQVQVRRGAATIGGSEVRLQWSDGPTLLNLAGPTESLSGAGHRYRYGEVDVAVVDGRLQAVLQLSLHDHYLRGIAEMPSSWPAAALESQVVAARTYALRKFRAGVRPSCRCHVLDTTADQVYAGWAKESDAGGARWVAAVQATSPTPTTGLTLTYMGEPASANYFSSSAGRTEANIDGFGGTTQFPYLRPVDDHWSMTSGNPFSAWSFTRSQAAVAAAFGLPDVEQVDLSRRTAGGAVRTATAVSSAGQRATITGSQFRGRLELPSRWIGPAVVRVAGADRYATSVAIGRLAAVSSTTVVIASGESSHLVDGLVAAPLARDRGAPLLLATVSGLPPPVGDDVTRRRATTALLVGGFGALGPGVEQALRARGVATVRRISGPTRFDTAAAVAAEMGAPRPRAVVASGETAHLVDALAAGGPAAGAGLPVLLTAARELPAATRQAIGELGVTDTVVAGGPAAIADAVTAQLPRPVRVSGADRFATAVAVARHFGSGAVSGAGLVAASGRDTHLVDALPGGALGLQTVLVAPTGPDPSTAAFVAGRQSPTLFVLGGTAAVSDAAVRGLQAAGQPTGRFPSRIAGFDEVGFISQPLTGVAVVGCAALADTPPRRAQGLTGRQDLAGYDGMVFAFATDTDAAFYMRNVPIPLSIAWFGADGSWVGAADMAPCGDRDDCPLYRSPVPYRTALETAGGDLGRLGVGSGSFLLAGGSCPG
ncbi:MAG TPA: SpoIID/LytB domain-containing protein [Acidimicrobiales bacterium]|nr:SpoIID/LytB domain-containing protein [Acidimicrobiales bacterium]